ncbi:glycosyl transferase family 2 [Rippkaea orientalis PCC 8801]|uniref:Glycosyl transferase family 2 n=1 Tax=Rippkaea orientalis (strain PCC 8801 / RF-1) TaxID=41431 RepID=B7JYC6_RIPO1|nr:glycosyltransferase [Rippkaea orientalis]ACK67228.1 glycosyl transferase family 2 [Rippkaea orientalis PCC 8801]
MKVLIADFDLFSKVGGGQTFYRSIIKKNPQIDFYYIAEKEPLQTTRPPNAHAIPYQEQLLLSDFKNFFEVTPPKWVERAFVMASNIAASVANQQFDVIDVPDYEQWGMFLRPALQHYRVNFSKIALSMHGKISKTLRLDWFDFGKDNIPLDLQEKMQYKTVDMRYGISKSYLDEWREISDLESHYYHPLHFLDLPKPTRNLPSEAPPSLNFIGRTEKRKGPDIFIDLVWWLPRSSYSKAQLIGPHSYNYNNTQSSESILQSMVKNRQKNIAMRPPMKREELAELFASKSVTFLPSRYDTLNLVALESLFSGCPTAIGNGAGICRFLTESFPEVPFINIDINDIYSSLPAIGQVLDNYEDYRRKLVDTLLSINLEVTDPILEEIYNQSVVSDGETQQELEQWYSQLMTYWEDGQQDFGIYKIPGVKLVKSQLKSQLKPTYKQFKATLNDVKAQLIKPLEDSRNAQTVKASKLVSRYKATFNASELNQKDLTYKVKECWRLGSAFGEYVSAFQESANLSSLKDKLSNGYQIDRIRLWREIARIEELRGNDLVSATYKLRGIRLLNNDIFGDLSFVLRTLETKGFTREAQAVEAIYGKPAERNERCQELIEQSLRDNAVNPEREYEFIDDRRQKSTYRVSIIVSLYNAADKLSLFLKALQHQTLINKGEAEIILVDSGSPGDEYAVFKQLEPKLNIPIIYARSQQRETIQTAWNRGISLSKAPYLCFLGVDENILPDCLEVLSKELDKDPQLDWVIGHSLVTNVDKQGSWVSDIMPYYRKEYKQDLVYLETCYLSWVGALYRRSIHERFGYYDGSFRGAGDTEFKNRVLPFIKSKVVDRTLGVFWNYPDERTTQSPLAELEDMRAWYLHRTLPGIRYAFSNRKVEELEQLIYLSLCYRKSYCTHTSSDLEYAYNLSLYLKEIAPNSQALKYFKGIETLLNAYRGLDWMPKLSRFSPIAKVLETRKIAHTIQQEHQTSWNKEMSLGLVPNYKIFNDNRHEQHSVLWLTEVPKN